MHHPSHSSLFYHLNNMWQRVHIKFLIMSKSMSFFFHCFAPKYQSRSEAGSLTVTQKDTFLRQADVSASPKPKLEDLSLSAVCYCLMNIFATTLLILSCSSIRNFRTRQAVVTGNHLPLAVTE
jgi:hypothetical protein